MIGGFPYFTALYNRIQDNFPSPLDRPLQKYWDPLPAKPSISDAEDMRNILRDLSDGNIPVGAMDGTVAPIAKPLGCLIPLYLRAAIMDLRQIGAAHERILSNGGKSIRNNHLGQLLQILEGPGPDSRHRQSRVAASRIHASIIAIVFFVMYCFLSLLYCSVGLQKTVGRTCLYPYHSFSFPENRGKKVANCSFSSALSPKMGMHKPDACLRGVFE